VTQRVKDAWAELAAWATESAGLSLSAAQLDQLRAYVALLQRWNAKIALISQRAGSEIVARHIADSVFAAAHCGTAARIADLGSGGGLPAVPIALLNPAAEVWCFEATAKKVSFLEATRSELRIGNLRVREGRIESAAGDPQLRGAFDLVTSRALAELEALRGLARPLLAPGGRLLAMRAAGDSAVGEVVAYALPDGTPRELAILGEV
jgi:16S rRNA (guanine527-N7)-methyltransferase